MYRVRGFEVWRRKTVIRFDERSTSQPASQTSKRMPCGSCPTAQGCGLPPLVVLTGLMVPQQSQGICAAPWWCFQALHPAHSRLRFLLETPRLNFPLFKYRARSNRLRHWSPNKLIKKKKKKRIFRCLKSSISLDLYFPDCSFPNSLHKLFCF